MKNKSSLLRVCMVFTVAISALFFNSCSKEEKAVNPQPKVDDEFGQFTKEVTIFDAENENSAVLLVGSDDESILNMWSSENFTLIPIKEGQTTKEVLDSHFSHEDDYSSIDEGDAFENESESEEGGASISTRFLSRNLKDGVERVLLLSNNPYDEDMRGWNYETHYSDYYGNVGDNTGTVTCHFYGQNFWYRGYYGLQYKKYSTSGWSDIVSEWKQIKRNETDSYDRSPCYVMKARRKYKGKNNNSVLVEFEY